jgi:O-antigen ligase
MKLFSTSISKPPFIFISAVLVVVTLPFGKNFSTIPIVLLVISWLFNFKKEEIVALLKEKYFWIFTTLFWLGLVGVAFANNTTKAFFIIKLYLPLLVFPVILFSVTINKNNILQIFKWFIIACFAASIYSYGNALAIWYTERKNIFYYTQLATIHPTYLATYILFSLIVIGNYFATQYKKLSLLKKVLITLLIIHFIIFTLLLSSRIAIIALALIFNALVVFHYIKKNISIVMLCLLLSINFIPAILIANSPLIKVRFAEIQTLNFTDTKNAIENSTNSRIIIWKSSIKLIKENFWLGVGTGDVTDELVKDYSNNSFNIGIKKRYNAHNQYLQVWLAYGLVGFSLFTLSFAMYWQMAIKNFDVIYLIFLLIMTIVFLTESYLQTQSGVVFFAFFNTLLFSVNNKRAIN